MKEANKGVHAAYWCAQTQEAHAQSYPARRRACKVWGSAWSAVQRLANCFTAVQLLHCCRMLHCWPAEVNACATDPLPPTQDVQSMPLQQSVCMMSLLILGTG
eukprot:1139024-Pelagomonas_calceolata.AAC.1